MSSNAMKGTEVFHALSSYPYLSSLSSHSLGGVDKYHRQTNRLTIDILILNLNNIAHARIALDVILTAIVGVKERKKQFPLKSNQKVNVNIRFCLRDFE